MRWLLFFFGKLKNFEKYEPDFVKLINHVATQSSTGTARRRMLPILFFSNSLRRVPSAPKTIIKSIRFHCRPWEIQMDVLYDLPESLVPWFSEHGLVTSLISCSTFVLKNPSITLDAVTAPIARYTGGRERQGASGPCSPPPTPCASLKEHSIDSNVIDNDVEFNIVGRSWYDHRFRFRR